VPDKRSKKRRATRGAAKRPRAGTRGAEIALANLAHDIRTPLTGILAMSELLLASDDLPDRERRWAAATKDAAGHLARLTTLVVDAAKAGSTGLKLHAEPFALRDFVNGVVQSLTARAEGKALDVKLSVAKGLPVRVTADAVRLRSALENLIDNAVKFTERGGVSLTVSAAPARRGRTRLTFAVADTGIGIIAADLKRLFRPFAQANEGIARRFGGAGLGLAFVRRIAETMGGSLTVKSRPGRGSTFRLTVLVDKTASAASAAPAQTDPAMTLRILCVEDNPYGRVVINTILSEFGHSVVFAGSGEAALTAVARGGHDLVLMDVVLPGVDGLETARRIRALPGPAGSVPIIGVSGRTADGDETAAQAAGMDFYLHKPLSPRQLEAAIAKAMARKAARQAQS
jgi:CheY-like chemotaxis protein